MSNLFSLERRTFLVTGAGGYIGSEISKGLGQAGAHVILCGRTITALQKVQDCICSLGGKADTYTVDLSNEAETQTFIQEIRKKHFVLHGIINNAYSGNGNSVAIPRKTFLDAYNITVAVAHQLIVSLLPELQAGALETGGGASVINIGTMYGTVSPDPSVYDNFMQINPPFYGAAKAGLLQLTRYLACQLGPQKIRVNSISPGPFPGHEAQKNIAFCSRLADNLPLKRIGTPQELVGPVLFLASDASSYINGINLPVDGGWTAW